MLKHEDGSAVLFPDKFEATALRRAQVEFDEGVCCNRLVEIDAEYHNVLVAAGKIVDDFAEDEVALVINAKAGLHLMADQGLDRKHLTLRGDAWHLHTGCRSEHSPPPSGISLASVGGDLDPGLSHQQRTVVHLRYCQDI